MQLVINAGRHGVRFLAKRYIQISFQVAFLWLAITLRGEVSARSLQRIAFATRSIVAFRRYRRRARGRAFRGRSRLWCPRYPSYLSPLSSLSLSLSYTVQARVVFLSVYARVRRALTRSAPSARYQNTLSPPPWERESRREIVHAHTSRWRVPRGAPECISTRCNGRCARAREGVASNGD